MNLVDDKKNSMFSAEVLKHRQIFRRRHDISALALDRLDENRRDFLGKDFMAEENFFDDLNRFESAYLRLLLIGAPAERIWHVMHAGNQRSEMRAVRGPARRQR